jgi:PAS domain S-box-containing protein
MTGSGRGRVLYVGPIASARDDARRLEAELDALSVDAFTGVEDALDRLSDGTHECVVVAREMATNEGVTVLRTVRDDFDRVPVVLVPADNSVTVARDAVSAGVDGYVPFEGDDPSFETLATDVRRVVDRYRDYRTDEQAAGFRRIAEQIDPTSIVVVDRELEVVWANDRARERFDTDERDRPSVVDTDVYDTDGEWVPPAERPYARVFETGDSVDDWVCRLASPEGHRWLSMNAAPIETTNGEYRIARNGAPDEYEYAVIAAEDVTDRRRHEHQLQAERDELAAEVDEIYRRISDAFVALDDEWRFTHLNEHAEELTGVSAEEVLGETLWETFPGAVGTAFEDRYREAMETQTSITFVARYPPLDSWFEVHAYPSESGLSIYFRDVSEKIEHEHKLERRAEQQTRLARLGQMALEATELDALFDEAVAAVAETLDHDYAKVLERRPDHDDLFLRAGVGWRDGLVGEATVPTDRESQAGYTLESSDPVVVEDLSVDDRFDGPDLLVDHDVTSGISVVIGPRENPWGVLGTHDRAELEFDEEDADFVQGVANVLATAIERNRREIELERQRERLAALEEVNTITRTINHELASQSTREEIERVVCARLAESDSYEFAWIGEAVDGTVRVRTEAGVDGYLDDVTITVSGSHGTGPTGTALRTGETQVVNDVLEDPDYEMWTDHAQRRGYRSSAAVPIVHQNDQYGVLNVYASRPGAFAGREREVISQLGRVIGMAVTAVERDQELRERERQYRTLVENLPNGNVGMFDTDLRYTRVGGNLYDRIPVDPAEMIGTRVGDVEAFPDDLRSRLVDAYGAAIDGESREIEVEYGGRTLDIRAVPLVEDDAVVGGLTLVQDVTERKRREAQLERQRDQLAFVNRILRHNLLNGLNVVQSRANLLEGFLDPEAMTHLETIRQRTAEMSDFVGMMRSFMKVVSPDEDHEFSPQPLGDVLESHLRRIERDFDDVEIRHDELPDVSVRADDLLGAILENILTNAIQHNDRSVVVLDVSIDVREDAVAVSVADNGPGISEDQRDRIFDRGVTGDTNPGSGFGLYFVHETIRKYGGEITIEDNDPRGTVVTLRFPLADV